MDTKARLDKLVTEIGTVAVLDVDGQDILRVVVEDAGPSNILQISAKLSGQKDFTLLKEISGPANEKVRVSAYEVVKIECTAIDATDVAVKVIASSFNEASGSAIQIDVPAGDSINEIEVLNLTSSDNSVVITGNNTTKSIDLKVNLNLDDVQEYPSLLDFPPVGQSNTLYVALDTEKIYRFSGSLYIEVSPSPVTSVNSQTGDVIITKSDVGLSNVDNTSDADKPISSATQTALNAKQDSLGFTPEDVTNKSTDVSLGTSDILYPSQNAVKVYVDAAITAGAPDADATTKGILKLTGDLGGTADSPTVPGLASKYDASNPAGYITLAEVPASAVTSVNTQTGDVVLSKSDIGLGDVDNTSDLNKPISTATQLALNAKYDASNPAGYITLAEVPAAAVTSVNSQTGDVVLAKSDIGLGNVDNTSDADKPISSATQIALNSKQDSLGFTPENVTNKSTDTSLGNSDTLYPSQNAVKVYVDSAVSAGAPDADSTTKGILKLTGDLGGTADSPTVPALANKQDTLISATNIKTINGESVLGSGDLVISGGAVDSVNGQTGIVILDKTDIGLSNVDNTSDLDKPISTATQTALNTKQDTLVSTTNIKSINGQSILGSGDLVISGGSSLEIQDEGTQITAAAISIDFTGSTVTASSDLSGNVTVNITESGEASTLIVEAYNETANLIPKMSVVYINGSHGNLPKLALSQANSEMSSTKTLGIVKSDISTINNGFVVATGRLEDLDTDIVGWNEGDSLWLSPTIAGGIQNSKPIAPNHAVFVGTLIRKHPNQGVIEVKIQNGYELEELHNVSISSLAPGQVLKYDDTTSLWKNATLTSSDVGLSNVDNTSDADKPISTATQTALNAKQDSLGFTPENVANKSTDTNLGTSDTLYPTQNAVKVYVDTSVASGAAPDATTASKGIIKLAGDLSGTADAPTVPELANKYDASNPAGYVDANEAAAAAPVQSVAGKVGAVSLDKSDVGLTNVDNTSDADKPVSTATQTALSTKQDTLVSTTNIKSINGQSILGSGDLVISGGGAVDSVNGQIGDVVLDKSDIGLSNVDNTSDADKPVSTATATALSEKVAKAGDTMTGTLTINTASNIAASLKDINVGNLFGDTNNVISVKDGGAGPLYIQSADQLDSFAGTTSKSSTLSSGWTTGANTGNTNISTGVPQTSGNSGTVVISTGSAQGGNSGGIQLIGGTTSGTSGNVFIQSGRALSTSTGATGFVDIRSGRHDSGASGNTGQVAIVSGGIFSATSSGTTGSVFLQSGVTPGTGNTGIASVGSGSAVSGTTGNVILFSGNTTSTGNTGQATVKSGDATATGNSGITILRSGSVTTGVSGQTDVHSGPASDTGSTGQVRIFSGNASFTGNTGDVLVASGSSVSGTTGNITIQTGSTSGTRGQVKVAAPYLNMETNEIINTSAFYFGDPNVDGTYRIRPSGSNLVTERRESGVWVVKQTITP